MIKILRLYNGRDHELYPASLSPQADREQLGCVLSMMLSISTRYQAIDLRDKVYGILGILQGFGIPLKIEVRYDVTICDLYMLTAGAFLPWVSKFTIRAFSSQVFAD